MVKPDRQGIQNVYINIIKNIVKVVLGWNLRKMFFQLKQWAPFTKAVYSSARINVQKIGMGKSGAKY